LEHSRADLSVVHDVADPIVLSPDLGADLANSNASPLPADVDAVFAAGVEPRSVHAVDFLLAAMGGKLKNENQTVLA
jgi:hypothetical protein